MASSLANLDSIPIELPSFKTVQADLNHYDCHIVRGSIFILNNRDGIYYYVASELLKIYSVN